MLSAWQVYLPLEAKLIFERVRLLNVVYFPSVFIVMVVAPPSDNVLPSYSQCMFGRGFPSLVHEIATFVSSSDVVLIGK